jgi:ribose-phosphate pyrophosphokinase
VQLLRERGARSVYVSCVHPIFAQKAYELLDTPDIEELVFTDTVPLRQPFEHVRTQTLSIAPLIGDAMHRIHTGGSVGELFL